MSGGSFDEYPWYLGGLLQYDGLKDGFDVVFELFDGGGFGDGS